MNPSTGSLREAPPSGSDDELPGNGIVDSEDLGGVSSDQRRMSYAERILLEAGKNVGLSLVEQIPWLGKAISKTVEGIMNTCKEASALKTYFDDEWKSRTEEKLKLLKVHIERMGMSDEETERTLRKAVYRYYNELVALKQSIESKKDISLGDVSEIQERKEKVGEVLTDLIQNLLLCQLSRGPQKAEDSLTRSHDPIAGTGLFALICKDRVSLVAKITHLMADMTFFSSSARVKSAFDRELCAIKEAKHAKLSQSDPVKLQDAIRQDKDLLILVGAGNGSAPHDKELRVAKPNGDMYTAEDLVSEFNILSTCDVGRTVRVLLLNSDDSQQYKSIWLRPTVRCEAPNLSMIVWHGKADQAAVADFTEGFLKARDERLSEYMQWNVPAAFRQGLKRRVANIHAEENDVSLCDDSSNARKVWEEMLQDSIIPDKIAVYFRDSCRVLAHNVKLLKNSVQRISNNLGVTEVSFIDSVYFEIKFDHDSSRIEPQGLPEDVSESLRKILGDTQAEVFGSRRGSIICSCRAEGTDILEEIARKEAEMKGQFSVNLTAYSIQTSSLQAIRGNVSFAQSVQDELRDAGDEHFFNLLWWLFEPSLPLTLGNIHRLARVRNKVQGFDDKEEFNALSEFVCSEFEKLVMPLHMSNHSTQFRKILEALRGKLKNAYDSGRLHHFSLERFVVACVNKSFVDGAAHLVDIAYHIIDDPMASDEVKQSAVKALGSFCMSMLPCVVSVGCDEFLKSKGFSFESLSKLPTCLSPVLKDPKASDILMQAAASAIGNLCSALAAQTSAWEGGKDGLLRFAGLLNGLDDGLECRLSEVLHDSTASDNLKQAAASALGNVWSAHAAIASALKGEKDEIRRDMRDCQDLADDSVRRLSKVLDDPKASDNLKQAAASALGNMGSAHAAIASAIKGEKDELRRHMGHFEDLADDAVRRLSEVLDDSKASDSLKQAAASALGNVWSAHAAIASALKGEKDEIQRDLGHFEDLADESVRRLSKVLDDPKASDNLKQAAASALGNLWSAHAAIVSALKGEKDEIRRHMGHFEDLADGSVRRLSEVLDNPKASDNLKQAAASALGNVWSAHAAIVSALKGEKDQIRRHMGHFEDLAVDSVSRLSVMLDNAKASDNLKQAAASALGNVWSAHAAIVLALKCEKYEIRRHVEHFEDLADDSVRCLSEVLDNPKASDSLKQAAASALGNVGSAHAAIASALKGEKDEIRRDMGHFVDLADAVVRRLSEVLDDPKASDHLKQAGASALGNVWSAHAAIASALKGENDVIRWHMGHFRHLAFPSVRRLSEVLDDPKASDNRKQAAASALGNVWSAHAAIASASEGVKVDFPQDMRHFDGLVDKSVRRLSNVFDDPRASDNLKQAAASALGNVWSAHAAIALASGGDAFMWLSRGLSRHLAHKSEICLINVLDAPEASEKLKQAVAVTLVCSSAAGKVLGWSSAVFSSSGFHHFLLNREIVLRAITQIGQALQCADDEVKNDKEFVSAAVEQNWRALQYAGSEVKMDKAVVLVAVNQDGRALQHAGSDVKKDIAVVLAAVNQDGRALEYADDEVKKDKAVVLVAVNQDGRALQYAGSDVKKDIAVVLAAVNQDGSALEYADDEVKKDKVVVLAAVNQDWRALEYADDEVKKDKVVQEVISNAVKQNWQALQYAGSEVMKDKATVLAAVNQDWRALQYADDEVKKDQEVQEVISVAVKQNWRALQYAGSEVKKDKAVVLSAVNQDWMAIQYADVEVKNDKEVVSVAVKQNWRALLYAGSEVKKDKEVQEVISVAVKQNWSALQYAGSEVKKDKAVVLAAVNQGWMALNYADAEVKNDKEVVSVAVKQDWRALQYAGSEVKKDKAVVSAAVIQDWKALQYADDEVKKDKEVQEVISVAVKQDWQALQYAGSEVKKDKAVVLAAVKSNWRAFQYADDELKKDNEVKTAAIIQNPYALD